MEREKHKSFEDYRENVSKLAKIAERVEFTTIMEQSSCGSRTTQRS